MVDFEKYYVDLFDDFFKIGLGSMLVRKKHVKKKKILHWFEEMIFTRKSSSRQVTTTLSKPSSVESRF